MGADVQKFRITFKCTCGRVFKVLTKNQNLEASACPECKNKNKKTKLFKIGDGPVPSTETKADVFEGQKDRVFPNTLYRCRACHSTIKIFEEIGDPSITECPSCGSNDVQYRGKISKDISGASAIANKAVDYTANVVMEDYKMGDIKDDIRPGEAMAPKLDPAKQNAADNFFGGARNAAKSRQRLDPIAKMQQRIASQAMAGKYRGGVDPVKAIQPAYKPKLNIVAGDGVKG